MMHCKPHAQQTNKGVPGYDGSELPLLLLLLQAMMGARGFLHSWSKQDVAAVFLEFWKKERTVPSMQQQQQGPAEQQQQQQQQRSQSPLAPLPFRCCTFLLIACAKNKPTQPVVPAARKVR
jgi:hypothetical protein